MIYLKAFIISFLLSPFIGLALTFIVSILYIWDPGEWESTNHFMLYIRGMLILGGISFPVVYGITFVVLHVMKAKADIRQANQVMNQ